MIIGIHHTAISTQNMSELTKFYRDVLGFEEVTSGSWEKGTEFADRVTELNDTAVDWIMLRASNCYIELFDYRSPRAAARSEVRPVNKPGFTHICLEVDNIMEMYEELSSKGTRFHTKPEDHSDAEMGCIATYARDPDGNVFELVQYEEGNIESLKRFVKGL